MIQTENMYLPLLINMVVATGQTGGGLLGRGFLDVCYNSSTAAIRQGQLHVHS